MRVPPVSKRFMFAPVFVKLSVAPGTVPEASIVAPVAPFRMRMFRFVLCAVEPVNFRVPPWKWRPTPVMVAFS